jgi:hypothetical protein
MIQWKAIEIEIDQKHFLGRYAVKDGIITVRYGEREKVTQIGGAPSPSLARALLTELVNADRRK